MNLRIFEIVSAYFLVKTGAGPYTIGRHEITLTNAVSFTPEESTITFEGSGSTTKIYLNTGLDFELTADSWPLESIDALFDDEPATTGLPSGTGSRRFYGDTSQSSAVAGLEMRAKAIDDDSGDSFDVLIVVARGTFSALTAPAGKSKDKSQLKLKGSAIRTTKDIADAAIVGLAGGKKCTWYIDTLDA
jgi:hypothetical protein